jgi:hypothetical protein
LKTTLVANILGLADKGKWDFSNSSEGPRGPYFLIGIKGGGQNFTVAALSTTLGTLSRPHRRAASDEKCEF